MNFVLALSLLASSLFGSALARAFLLMQDNDLAQAANSLDAAAADDPGAFAANNLHYLRGRLAAGLKDWSRASTEFEQVLPENPLYALALSHRAYAAAVTRDDGNAEALISQLPAEFPAGPKMEIAKAASDALALKIYQTLTTREARFERARLQTNYASMWILLRERKDDDVAIRAATFLAPVIQSTREYMDAAEAFLAHRYFDEALRLYQTAARDKASEAEARYQTARAYFLSERYSLGIDIFREVAAAYAGSHWEKDARYQIASSLWRLGDHAAAERAYLEYIQKYSAGTVDEGSIRNLVDIYRVQGSNEKALSLLDRTLAKRLSTTGRQVFLFTKAKILFSQKKYSMALFIFQQLGRMRLRSIAGGTNGQEVQYFQAMCQWQIGNEAAANLIWRKIAESGASYYGLKAAARLQVQLGGSVEDTGPSVCSANENTAAATIAETLLASRHPIRTESEPFADAASELSFLQLWDEASLWQELSKARPDYLIAGQIAYMAGRFNRAIAYAGRLPKAESSTLALLYPAGFRKLICSSSAAYNVDPLWLHAIIWQESKYNPRALSGASARGLMQFIPDTASTISTAVGISGMPLDRLYDPAISIQLGAYYWSSLVQELKSPAMALAAYNGGIDNVRRWKSKFPDGDEEFFVADIGFVETKNYVMAVFAARAAYGSLK